MNRLGFFCCVLLATLPTIAASPTISTFAGTGVKGFSGDGGPAAKAQLNNPYGITIGPDGALFVCDVDNQCVRRVAKDGTISTVAGTPGQKGYAGDGGPATSAKLYEPYEVRFDQNGDLFFVERLNHLVRKVDMKSGVISTVAGTGKPGFGGDGGPANAAQFNEPHSIQFDPAGDLYVCDIKNHRVRKIDMKTGVITTFAGTGKAAATPEGAPVAGTPLNGPRALDFGPDGNCYLALREGNAIFQIDMKRLTYKRLAGTGKKGFEGNGGPATAATLSGPKGVSVAGNGDVYFADTESHSIRRIEMKSGTLTLVAGTGQKGDGPDGDPLKCQFNRPHGIYVGADGVVYVGDSENHRVRVVR